MRDYQEILAELVEAVRDQCSEETVSFNLFINCQGYEFKFNKRTSGDLRVEGISMRNLKGDFIK